MPPFLGVGSRYLLRAAESHSEPCQWGFIPLHPTRGEGDNGAL